MRPGRAQGGPKGAQRMAGLMPCSQRPGSAGQPWLASPLPWSGGCRERHPRRGRAGRRVPAQPQGRVSEAGDPSDGRAGRALGRCVPQNTDVAGSRSETQYSQGLFHKGLYGFGNLNTVEPELNRERKSLSLYILEERNSIKWDFSCFNKIGLSLFKIRAPSAGPPLCASSPHFSQRRNPRSGHNTHNRKSMYGRIHLKI